MLSLLRDYTRFLEEVSRPIPDELEWTTRPNTKDLELDNVILRNFSDGNHESPTLIIPPQAGHHSNIADYGPGQSLVQAVKDTGKAIYVTEWKGATKERKHETIDDFIEATDRCVDKIGKKVNLIGLCQGGWQSAIYAALYPEKVNALVIAAAPIDFRAGNGKIQMFVDSLDMQVYKFLVKMGGGNMPGRYMVAGFKMLNPIARFYKDFADLFYNINNDTYVDRHHKFRDWYEWTQDLPGDFYLQVVEELFKENKLIKGELEIQGRKVDLKRINHPLFLIAGKKDDITLEEQVFNMEHYVSSEDITKLVVPAGHIGVFMGGKIIRDYWPRILEKI